VKFPLSFPPEASEAAAASGKSSLFSRSAGNSPDAKSNIQLRSLAVDYISPAAFSFGETKRAA